MQKLLLYIFLALFVVKVFAQPTQIVFDHFDKEKGFPSKEALSIAQQTNGIIWIASNNGLIKYDSKQFTLYQHIAKDSNTITSNYCKKIFLDTRGMLWIATARDLDVLNTATNKITHLNLFIDGQQRSVKPTFILQDKFSDVIWIGTYQGLYFCKAGSLQIQHCSKFTSNATLHKEHIGTIVQYKSNELWISCSTSIIKLNTNSGGTEICMVPQIIDGINNYPDQGNFLTAYFAKNNCIYYGTWCRGLIEFNIDNKKFHQYAYRTIHAQENTIPDITATDLPNQQHIIWLTTYGSGLCTFNLQTKKFTPYVSNAKNNPLGILGNTYGLLATKDALWIGSETGLHAYNFKKQIFSFLDFSSITDGRKFLSIAEIAIERNNFNKDEFLWFHVPYYNAYIFDLNKNIIKQIPKKISKYLKPPSKIFGFYIDAQNKLWINTSDRGLIVYDIKNDEIIIPEHTYFYKDWQWITTFLEDEDVMWIGTFSGLFKYNKSSGKIDSVITVNKFLAKGNYANAIMGLTKDELGNIWFTADYNDKKNASICRYNPKTQAITMIYNERIESLPFNKQVELRKIVSDKKGRIFASFFNEDIKWCPSNATSSKDFQELNKTQGLQDYFIDQLLVDTAGKLWLTNSMAIASYKSAQNIFTNYEMTTYGLDVNGNPLIYFSPNTQKLYVGQSNKIAVLNTQEDENEIKKSALLINEIKVANKLFQSNLQNGETINLTHKQNYVTVDFSLLSFTNADKNTYAWYLEGVETEWNFSNNNKATYANLQPNNYVLHLKAANSMGQWSLPAKIFIHIKPPFYKTWWFLICSIIAIIAIVYCVVHLRILRIKEKFQFRNKIASDLHDEIGSTLTSINILSNVSQQAMDSQPLQAKEMLAQISLQSKTIQQNMSDIVWSIRPDNETVEDLLVRMREYAAVTLEPLEINFTIDADEKLITKNLPVLFRKDVLLIYKEAVNNIAKHAGANACLVTISNGNKQIVITISDNGLWKGNNSGTGTKTMQERAKAIGALLDINVDVHGTQIKLKIPIP